MNNRGPVSLSHESPIPALEYLTSFPLLVIQVILKRRISSLYLFICLSPGFLITVLHASRVSISPVTQIVQLVEKLKSNIRDLKVSRLLLNFAVEMSNWNWLYGTIGARWYGNCKI